MKGRTPNAAEKLWMNKVAGIGCIVCLNNGYETPQVTPHHMSGRTKRGCHFHVIPLCSKHHQVSDLTGQWVSRHGPGMYSGKAMFEDKYGTEMELYHQCLEIIGSNDMRVEHENS
jgi:hypothetical protein